MENGELTYLPNSIQLLVFCFTQTDTWKISVFKIFGLLVHQIRRRATVIFDSV
jgi:hypothetical protein